VIQFLFPAVRYFYRKQRIIIYISIVSVILLWKPDIVAGQQTVVTPSISVTERYESNPYFVEGRDDEWEVSTSVSPKITFVRSYSKSDLSGSLGANIEYYPNDTDLNNESYHASLGINYDQTPKTRYAISERFSFSQDSININQDVDSDQDLENNADIGIQVERNNITSNRLSFSGSHDVSPSVTVGLNVGDRRTEYESPSLNDTRSFSISPFVDYGKALKIAPRTTLTTGYDFTRYYVESDGDDETRDTHSLSVGIDHRVTPDFSLSASVGAVYSSETGFDWGLIGDIKLSRSTRRSKFTLTYSRNVDVSPYTNDLNTSQGLSARLSTKITQSVSSSMNVGVNTIESETSDAVDTVSYRTGISVSWQAYSWMDVSAGYSYFEQESDGTVGDDLARNVFFVRARFIPIVWRF
jgi:hypothetical protein